MIPYSPFRPGDKIHNSEYVACIVTQPPRDASPDLITGIVIIGTLRIAGTDYHPGDRFSCAYEGENRWFLQSDSRWLVKQEFKKGDLVEDRFNPAENFIVTKTNTGDRMVECVSLYTGKFYQRSMDDLTTLELGVRA